jgi:Family of unknown function (DUF6527)
MSRLTAIEPRFVEFVPKDLEDGVLYISVSYSTTVHKCACGSKIALPINPARWRYLWDGERISVWPSVGNWSYPCKSHYWIEQNRIEWASQISAAKIEVNRARDRAERERYLESRLGPTEGQAMSTGFNRGLIDRVRGLFRR